MAEYIDRDAFLEQERAWYCKNCIRRTNSNGKIVYEIGETPCRACYIEDILDDVENCPAADVVVRKAGKWFMRGGQFRCSVCDSKALWLRKGSTGGWSHEYNSEHSNYCPNCGARMEP